jgi:hypothetical protein
MKKGILVIGIALSLGINAQETISMGTGYANHIWYSLENETVGTAAKDNWELAFEIGSMGAGIRSNRSVEMTVWKYPTQGLANWATLDTNGMAANWDKLFNDDRLWEEGAFNQLPQGLYNYGWGTYNTVSHIVDGVQMYVIQLPDETYRKIRIDNKTSGTYTFTISNLDNSGEVTRSISSNGGPSDNALFGYYSITNDEFINREPNKTDWDLCFLQYNAVEFGTSSNQRVVGVLHHPLVEVAKIHLDNPTDLYDAASVVYSLDANSIGYDWKVLNYQTFQWEIQDTLVYLIKAQNGDYWELRFTAFGGTSTGDISFTKTKIGTASLEQNVFSLFEIYPNPSNGIVNFVIDANEPVSVQWFNMYGQIVHQFQHDGSFSAIQQDLSHLDKGIYFVKAPNYEQTIKIILR